MTQSSANLPRLLGSLEWRNIGPHRGGRSVAVAGHPHQYATFYMGTTGGGVWKTTNAGITWVNVSDGFFRTSSVGALAIAESDPNIIYAGMGESSIRGNVTRGDGVYKTTDGGRTWTHTGLAETRHIARIRVHPQDPDLVYVAALGHAFGPHPARGVYRSRDGGRTWQLILHRSERAGASDLSMDATNPRVLYASLWQVQRGEWFLNSGGPESGLFKSVDGGDTWTELTGNPGLPAGPLGKIGVAVSPAWPERVWALIEAKEGGVFRSDDAGATWQRLNDSRALRSRSFYYSHIHAHPTDPETVFVLTEGFYVSNDGGVHFAVRTTPHGDHHDLWIDPRHPERMIHGADGGATISLDGGLSWSSIENQPTEEFYNVTTDTRFPYRVYGAQQDNTTLSAPSRSEYGAIGPREIYDVGGAESGCIAVRPDDPDIVYAGSSGGGEGGRLTRYDHRTKQKREISVWPEQTAGLAAQDYKYRFQWTSPILISPHDPNVLYFCGNIIFRTTDEGQHWQAISPDLSRNDPATLGPSGGPISQDHTGVEVYGTVFAFAESHLTRGLLWAGSDDGLVHVSRDDGAHWQNVTPPALPTFTRISVLEPSRHDPAVCYLAATRYRMDDFTPYLYVTRDYGRSWQRITDGIEADDFTRVIREDPEVPGLLFCGTESGVYVSLDDGGHWQRLQLNLPVVPVHDLKVKERDLVIATHGRGFWILDDITPLQELAGGTKDADAAWLLFRPRDTVRWRPATRGIRKPKEAATRFLPGPTRTGGGQCFYLAEFPDDGRSPRFLDAGQNPPLGVMVRFVLDAAALADDVSITVLDEKGGVVRQVSTAAADEADRLKAADGANCWVWNMRYPSAMELDDPAQEGFGKASAPWAPPGRYTVRLEAGSRVAEESFQLLSDPRLTTSQADYEEQFDLACRVRDLVTDIHKAVTRLRTVRGDINAWTRRADQAAAAGALAVEVAAEIRKAGEMLLEGLGQVERELIQVAWQRPSDDLWAPPMLNSKVAHLAGVISASDDRPTQQMHDLYGELKAAVTTQLDRLEHVLAREAPSFESMLREAGVPLLGGAESTR